MRPEVVKMLRGAERLVEHDTLRTIPDGAADSDLSMGRMKRPCQNLQERRFAGTVFTDDANERTARRAERNVRQYRVSPIAFGEVGCPDGHCRRSRSAKGRHRSQTYILLSVRDVRGEGGPSPEITSRRKWLPAGHPLTVEHQHMVGNRMGLFVSY